MTTNPVVLRSRLITIQTELMAIKAQLAGAGRQEAMAWQALCIADDSIGWATTHLGQLVAAKLTKTEQAEEAASRA